MLKLVDGISIRAVAADYGLDPAPMGQLLSHSIYRMRIVDGSSPSDIAEALMDDPLERVIYADPNFVQQAPEGSARVIYAGGGNDGDYVAQWAPGLIRLPEAHLITRGAGTIVAVLDTGVDFSHPTLAGRLLNGYDFVGDDPDPSEEGVYGQNAEYGHGTHVAGIVALTAPDAMIMPIRVLDSDGLGSTWTLAEGIAYASDPDGNPNTNDGADVINLSLSSLDRSRLIRDVVRAAICADSQPEDLPCFQTGGRNAVVVIAAGNRGSSTPEYPAGDARRGAISVGASTQSDELTWFSNYGFWVNVAAPGQGILSTVPGGGYGTWSGTSMAAPFVAGEAALVRSRFPTLAPAKVAQRVIQRSFDIGGPVKCRIDAAAALAR